MANKRLIKSAVDSGLSTHGIVDSGYEGKLSDLAMDEVRTIMTDKFRGNTEYLGRAKLLEGIGEKNEVRGLLDLKEEFFFNEFERLSKSIDNNTQLRGFHFDELRVSANSAELQYNELQRQLRNFADGELEAPNKILRQKISALDPNYNFSRFDKLSWSRQNEILGNELNDLQSYAADVNELKKQVLALNPNYDDSRISGKSLQGQFRSLSGTLANLENKNTGRSALQARLKSMDNAGFNELWNVSDPKLRRDIRGSWGDDYVYKENGVYYRSGIDTSPSSVRPPEPQRGPVRDLSQEQRDRFTNMSNLNQKEFQREWNNLSEYEKTLYQEQVGAVDTFRDSYGNLIAIQDGNQNQLASLDDKIRSEYEAWLVNRDNVLWNETNQFAEAARAQRLLDDRQRLKFEHGERPVQEEMSGYTPVGESPEGGQIEAATEETNEITMAATEERVVGERGAAQIERRSMSNILATDTAASYAFGYKQKALLGVMGTVGVVSLLEANSHGGGREALERKRQLEEQRRMKKYGY